MSTRLYPSDDLRLDIIFFGLQNIDILPLNNNNAGFILYLFMLFLLFSFIVIIKLIRQILKINRKLEQIQ